MEYGKTGWLVAVINNNRSQVMETMHSYAGFGADLRISDKIAKSYEKDDMLQIWLGILTAQKLLRKTPTSRNVTSH